MPSPLGRGPQIRAFLTLRALAHRYDVSLLVADTSFAGAAAGDDVKALTAHVSHFRLHPLRDFGAWFLAVLHRIAPALYFRLCHVPPELRHVTADRIARVTTPHLIDAFDLVHVFRLYMAPFVVPFLRQPSRGRVQLDLDDIESVTRRRVSSLYRVNGDSRRAASGERDAAWYSRLERLMLPMFDTIFVCSDVDKEHLQALYGPLSIDVLPNAVEARPEALRWPHHGPFRFLFVGSLGYYPNRDAVHFFCDDVLPAIRQRVERPCEIQIVGGGLGRASRRRLGRLAGVTLPGAVNDLARFYEHADAVVVPVRAGGGTRIKILEAFSYRRPVITTSIGVEGIDAIPGKDVLVGDTAEEFAAHAISLIRHPNLGRQLAENGSALQRRRYSVDRLQAALLRH